MSDEGLQAAERKMRDAGQPAEAIRAFRAAYARLVAGEAAMLPSAELEPAPTCQRSRRCRHPILRRRSRMSRSMKLNGGLATTMGLGQPKSLGRARRAVVPRRDRRTDVALRRRLGDPAAAAADGQRGHARGDAEALAAPPGAEQDLPPDFLQSMIPKLEARSALEPVSWPPEPALEWCPPGHGDVYGALAARGCSTRCSSAAFATR